MTEPRDILEALFVGDDADRAQIAEAGRAAAEDAELRALFDGLARVDRELGGDFEARFGEAWFLDSLDAMLAEESAATPDAEPEQEHEAPVVVLSERRRFAAGAVVFAAAAAVLLTLGPFGRPAPEEFQARSAARTDAGGYATPSVEVFCVKRTAEGIEFVGTERAELATVRCALDHEIKLAVRNPDARLRYAAFVGLGEDGTPLWYGPSPAATSAIAVPQTDELQPIGETIRLDVNHSPGSVRLVGIFAENALDFAEFERLVERHGAALRDGEVVVPAGMVVRQTFEVTP